LLSVRVVTGTPRARRRMCTRSMPTVRSRCMPEA
jgi:hypothetical protein